MTDLPRPDSREGSSAARTRRWPRRFKLYKSGNARTLYVKLRSRDRHYLVLRWHTYTYGPVTQPRRTDGHDGVI